jgi:hypothetical protein
MSRVLRWRWIGSSVVAWLVLAAVNAVLPARAEAGCSHPWVQSTRISTSLLDLGSIETGRHDSLAERGSPGSPGRPGPCAGGACSRSPELPLSSTVEVTPHSDHWGGLPAEPVRTQTNSRDFMPEEDERRPAGFPAPIERPPRLNHVR